MTTFECKLHQNGPIHTVHLTDNKENLYVGFSENLEEAISMAAQKMVVDKTGDSPDHNKYEAALQKIVELDNKDDMWEIAYKVLESGK